MTITTNNDKKLKHFEYYNLQETFDNLYEYSKNNKNFKKLYDLIISKNNILLAYRTIKNNKGSKTVGVNNKTIKNISKLKESNIVNYIRNRLKDFKPHKVRRIEIPKADGGTRALGIPTIEDRIIQQCFKQVLEPICEAKFYNHSYGFRPNRSQSHAISRMLSLANRNKLHYVVDVDIKGFFDNINHSKLLKQLWTLGIKDKKVISIISKMLKAEILGIGKSDKGTPQGGILSPLLSNIYLNELDWWISNQWENMITKHNYATGRISNKGIKRQDNSAKYLALKKSNLKEIYIVRYADDFKIFCRSHETANRIFIAVKKWLKERLHLEVNNNKSKIINIRKKYSEFLGFKFKLVNKGNKKVVNSYMSNKSKKKAIENIKKKIKEVKKHQIIANVNKLNVTIIGIQNYYRSATHITKDLSEIAFLLSRIMKNNFKYVSNNYDYDHVLNKTLFARVYGDYKNKRKFIANNTVIFPIDGMKHKNPMNFTQEICNYSVRGRELISNKKSKISNQTIQKLLATRNKFNTIEFNDNRISKFFEQNGKCKITKNPLNINKMEVHHIKPRFLGGTDDYTNLVIIENHIHKLIHLVEKNKIEEHLIKYSITKSQLKKINFYRNLVENMEI